MARKAAITDATLKALDLDTLVGLLLEACDHDDATEKKVRMVLASRSGGDALDTEIGTRIKSLTTGKRFHDWQSVPEFSQSIDAVRVAITDTLGAKDPKAAMARLWQLIEADSAILKRVDDSSGRVSGALRDVCADLGRLLAASGGDDSAAFAERVHKSFLDNAYGVLDDLVVSVAVPMGAKGRARLRALFEKTIADAPPLKPRIERVRGEPHDYRAESRLAAAARGLMAIADADGDVDAFVRAADAGPYRIAHVEEVAARLLKARRPADAMAWIERVPPDAGQWRDSAGDGLVGLKLKVLDALKRKDEAQQLRLALFEKHLWSVYLREYVKRLPDFEDDAVIRRAIAHASQYPSALEALMFLVDWPALDAASDLVFKRAAEIDGRHYDHLNHAVDRLEAKHPAAATILLRAKIDSVLARASATQYGHAVRDLERCAALATRVDGSATLTTHADYVAHIRAKHARKPSFMEKLKAAGIG
jgi:hypothetical protein